MRTTVTVALLFLVGVVLFAPRPSFASSELSEGERPEAGADAKEVNTSGPSPEVRIEVLLLEAKGGGVRELQAATGIKLTWERDQVVLSEEQKEQLLSLIAEKDGMRLVARGDARVPVGEEAVVELQGVLLHPLKRESDSKAQAKTATRKAAAATPSADKDKAPEAGKVSARIAVRATLMGSSLGIVATVTANVSMKFEPEEGKKSFPQTTVSTTSKTTSVVLKDGSSVVVREPLLKAIFASLVPPKESEKALLREDIEARLGELVSREDMEARLGKLVKDPNFPRTRLTAIRDFIRRDAGIRVEVDPSARPILDARSQTRTSSTGPASRPALDISLNLHDVSLGDILTEALRQKELKYIIDVEDNRLLIVPENYVPPQDLKSTLFFFLRSGGAMPIDMRGQDPELCLLAEVVDHGGASSLEPAVVECVREALMGSGLSWPEGSAVKCNPKTGVMVVTNTRENARIIESLVGVTTQLWLRPENQQCLLTIISAKIVEPK